MGIGLQMFRFKKKPTQADILAKESPRTSAYPTPGPEKVAIKAQGRNLFLAIRRAERAEQERRADEAWLATKGLRASIQRRK